MNTDMVSIAELADVNPKTDLQGLDADSFVSFIPMADVTETGQWIGHQERHLRDVRVGYTPFVEEDVLFAKITPCMENGKGAHVKGLKNGVGFGSTEFHVLRARNGNDPRFLFHWLQAKPTRLRAIAFMGGSAGQQRVQQDFFINYRVPAIEPTEQFRITYVLDTIDQAIAKTEAVITKLKQVRAGMLHDLLSYGLDENDQLRDPIAHPEQFKDSPLGRIPRDWDVRSLYEVLEIRRGFAFSSSDYVEYGILNFRVTNVGRSTYVLGDTTYLPNSFFRDFPNQQLFGGEIVIVMVGATTGKLGRVPNPTTAFTA